jgi:6,7-dimethyl-8-ribityllumazine synthase
MVETVTGDLFVKANQKFCLVVAEFNEFITSRLAKSATECLMRHGAKENQIKQIWVPGCFEIPTVASHAAKSAEYSAIICLGCVVRGQTSHYDHVADQVSRGVGAIGPATGVPAVFGVITADTLEQAIDRAGAKGGNAGWSAACAAISMASVMAKLRGEPA